MRSYQQQCGLAKALDLVGDRWTLLIVRELLIREACRYTDIKNGLPGIATNLLAERLSDLESAGVIVRREAPPPVATTVFELTERGRALEPAILQLGSWGAPLLAAGSKRDRMQAHWLVLPLRLHLADTRPADPPAAIELCVDDERIAVSAANGKVDVRLGGADHPAARVKGKPETVLKLFTGRIGFAGAKAAGVSIEGVRDTLRRVIPKLPADR